MYPLDLSKYNDQHFVSESNFIYNDIIVKKKKKKKSMAGIW